MYTYQYPRPSLTVDCVIFGLEKQDLKVLLIERADEPYKHHWALPGGFVDMDEDLDTAARRELEEETGVKNVFIEQLYTFGTPNRDPRGRVVSVAYYALVNLDQHLVVAASDARQAKWVSLKSLPHLAFDHAEILKIAVQRLQGKVDYQPIGFELLPKNFTIAQLQQLYETILDVKLNKRNFRTKILKMGVLEEVDKQQEVAHRPAVLYQFNKKRYDELTLSGMDFYIKLKPIK